VYIVGALGARTVRVVTVHWRWSATVVVVRVWALSLNTPRSLMGELRCTNDHPPSRFMQWRYTKTGSKMFKGRRRQSLRHDVRELFSYWHMQNSELSQLHSFANKVYVKLNVLCSLVMNWI
jgi:hypothetical protein